MSFTATASVNAQLPECNVPPSYVSCDWTTARAASTQTQAAAGATETPPLTGTFPPFGIFATYSPSGTPGVNYTCPEDSFDTDNLEPDWAFACRLCVDAVRPTVTRYIPQVGLFPTSQIGTAVIPTAGASPTIVPSATVTLTPSETGSPAPTPTPSSWIYKVDFRIDDYGANIVFNAGRGGNYANPSGIWQAGVGFSQADNAGWNALRLEWEIPEYIIDSGYTQVAIGYYHSFGVVQQFGNLYDALTGTDFTWSLINGTDFSSPDGAADGETGTGFATLPQAPVLGDRILIGNDNGNYFGWTLVKVHFAGTGTPPEEFPPTATPTLTPTMTGTALPPTQTGTWSPLQSTYQSGVVSANCEEPRYVDTEAVLADVVLQPSGNVACMLITPRFSFGFSAVNAILGFLSGSDVSIPDIDVPRVELCFIGITLNLNIFGFVIDMAIIIAFPIAAFLFRWAMRH